MVNSWSYNSFPATLQSFPGLIKNIMPIFKGTTNLGFHFEKGILLAVDSKITNVRAEGNVTHDIFVTDSERKYFELSSKALILCTFMGLANDWDGMYHYVREKDPTSVKQAVTLAKSYITDFTTMHRRQYLAKYRIEFGEDASFGALIAGYDDKKGFQLYSLTLQKTEDEDDVELAALGSGADAALNFVKNSGKYENLTTKQASLLGFRSLLESATTDRYSGGIFHVIHLRDNGFSKVEANFLDVYLEFYETMDIKDRTLFFIHLIDDEKNEQDTIVGDEFLKAIWRIWKPPQKYAYEFYVEVARKRDFHFYHLGFKTEYDARSWYSRIDPPRWKPVTANYTTDLDSLIRNWSPCGKGGKETVYVAKGSKLLLESICNAASI